MKFFLDKNLIAAPHGHHQSTVACVASIVEIDHEFDFWGTQSISQEMR